MSLRLAAAAGCLLAAHGCVAAEAAPPTPPPAGWTWVAPVGVHVAGLMEHPSLAEASGVAPSRSQPGVLWSLGDSGNPPELLATDTTGRLLARMPVPGAVNRDWEEIALGPCPAGRCLHLADLGDNAERRTDATIYRIPEPTLRRPEGGRPDGTPTVRAESLRVTYPDGPHDVEAMAVDREGTILLVTKGRSKGVLLFTIGADAWREGRAVAVRRDSLPIAAVEGMGRLVTGMALSPDERVVVVRTYRDLFPFARTPDGTLRPLGQPTACNVLGLEPQGEAIAFLDAKRLVLLSERGLFKGGTVVTLECAPTSSIK